jgi:hypothetical protein
MPPDVELKELLKRVRAWHTVRMRRYKNDLPDDVYYAAYLPSLQLYQRAKQSYYLSDLRELRIIARSVNYHIEPWSVTAWYALNTKKV